MIRGEPCLSVLRAFHVDSSELAYTAQGVSHVVTRVSQIIILTVSLEHVDAKVYEEIGIVEDLSPRVSNDVLLPME